ncbi:hypothetical protein Tco_0865288 [Tanacetum coccineum]
MFTDGLMGLTEGSTAVTNFYFTEPDKVMLLRHSDDFLANARMHLTSLRCTRKPMLAFQIGKELKMYFMSQMLHTSYLCEYVDLYYIELGATDAGPTGTWGDRYNCGHDLQDVRCQFRYRPPNKDDFRVLRFAHFIVEMDGDTVVRKSSVRPDGFARDPFPIDVVGGQSVRVTLLGGLGEMLIEKRTRHIGLYPIVLTAMSVKLYNNKLYLSSTSSTMIVDDEQIPFLKQFKSDDSSIELAKELLPADSTGAKAGTLENLLMWARNQKYDATTFHCVVRIDKIRTKRGGITHHVVVRNVRRAISTASMAAFGVTRAIVLYRLELEVSDDTTHMVVVMFDETARTVDEEETGLPLALANIVGILHTLELKSNSYYEHANYESFTCWSIVLKEALDESGSSGTLSAAGDPKTGVFVPLTTTPSVTTPSKPGEHKKPRSKERHDSDGEESFVADSKTKRSDVGCSSEARKRRRQYGSAIKEAGRVPTTTKFNVIRVLNK